LYFPSLSLYFPSFSLRPTAIDHALLSSIKTTILFFSRQKYTSTIVPHLRCLYDDDDNEDHDKQEDDEDDDSTMITMKWMTPKRIMTNHTATMMKIQ
jgi:hypothetical protein